MLLRTNACVDRFHSELSNQDKCAGQCPDLREQAKYRKSTLKLGKQERQGLR